MKTFLSQSLLVLGCLLLSSTTSHAQVKLATIDLKKVFDNYYKTRQADATLKERASDFDKTRKSMLDDYQSLNERYRKELDSANDQAVSSEEREKRKRLAESTLLEIKKVEADVTAFDRSSRNTLGEQQRRMWDNILREIRELISARAKAASVTMVVDTAAETANHTPVFLYASAEYDLTEDILKQLNASAPAESAKPDAKEKAGDRK
jgi:outer membrane protein